MKKFTLVLVVVAFAIIWKMYPTIDRFDKGPKYVQRIVNFDLPHYDKPVRNYVADLYGPEGELLEEETESVYYNATFSEELSEDCISKLNSLCQSKPENWSIYISSNGKYISYDYIRESRGYRVFCRIDKRGFSINYTVPYSAGISGFLMIPALFLILLFFSIYKTKKEN